MVLGLSRGLELDLAGQGVHIVGWDSGTKSMSSRAVRQSLHRRIRGGLVTNSVNVFVSLFANVYKL